MRPVAIANDLVISADTAVPGVAIGIATSAIVVTSLDRASVSGVIQSRSRAALGCRVVLQSGWPVEQPLPDWANLVPAAWHTNGSVDLPATTQDLPVRFSLTAGEANRRFFPMVRVRWLVTTSDGSVLLPSDHLIVSAQLQVFAG